MSLAFERARNYDYCWFVKTGGERAGKVYRTLDRDFVYMPQRVTDTVLSATDLEELAAFIRELEGEK